MPRIVSPAEALQRVRKFEDSDPTPRETVSCRVAVDLFRAIAHYGVEKKASDLSKALRMILEEWFQARQLGQGLGLAGFDTESLAAELDKRGLAVIDTGDMVKRMQDHFKTAQKKLNDILRSMQDEKFLEKMTEGEEESRK